MNRILAASRVSKSQLAVVTVLLLAVALAVFFFVLAEPFATSATVSGVDEARDGAGSSALGPGLAQTSSERGTVVSALGVLWLIASLSALVASLGHLILRLTGRDPGAAGLAERIFGPGTADSEVLARSLTERWLRRSRFSRFVGGTAGFILGFPHGELGTKLAMVVAGVAVGGALAELHVFRSGPKRRASADLSVRRVSDYTDRLDRIAMAALVIGAVVVIALPSDLLPRTSRAWPAATLAIVVATFGFQRLVASRPRPAIDADLRKADDILRYLAATLGFARPAIALGFITLAASFPDEPNLNASPALLIVLAAIWLLRGRQSKLPEVALGAAAVS